MHFARSKFSIVHRQIHSTFFVPSYRINLTVNRKVHYQKCSRLHMKLARHREKDI